MENIGYTLTIGALGSVIGAAVVSLGAYGWHFTKKSIMSAKKRFEKECDIFYAGEPEERSKLTNEYLFSALRFLFIANLAWILPEFIDAALNTTTLTGARHLDREVTWTGFWIASVSFKGAGLAFFYFGLGRIMRYVRITRTPPTIESSE